MRKTIKVRVLLSIAIASIVSLAGCKNNPTVAQSNEQADSIVVEKDTTYLLAIDRYLTNEIGKKYAEAEYCVPFHSIVDVDESNKEDIQVWGDFWVFNYNQVGDTLKTISGGNHPGRIHVRQTDAGFEVIGFDQVADGADNLTSAKQIFGDNYDAFHAVQSDEQKREQLRAEVLADYVKAHNLTVTLYQDYGWPAKELSK